MLCLFCAAASLCSPGSSIQEALSRLRPLEGNTCPVVLAVPPPDPLTPAHAAAAAAAAAASSHMPAAEEFDHVNRLPPQVLALHGHSSSGQRAVSRSVAAVACRAAEEQAAVVDSWRLASAGRLKLWSVAFLLHGRVIYAAEEQAAVVGSWRLAFAGGLELVTAAPLCLQELSLQQAHIDS